MLRQSPALWGHLRLAAGLPVYVLEAIVFLDGWSRHLLWSDVPLSQFFLRVPSTVPPRRPS